MGDAREEFYSVTVISIGVDGGKLQVSIYGRKYLPSGTRSKYSQFNLRRKICSRIQRARQFFRVENRRLACKTRAYHRK